MSLNSVILQGNLVADPELVGSGDKKVVRFSVAVNTGFGEFQRVSFINVVGFGRQAPVIAQHFSKGRPILVKGSLIQNSWETPEGEKRSRLEVHLDNFDGFFFIGDKRPTQEATVTEEEAVAAGTGVETTDNFVETNDGRKLF